MYVACSSVHKLKSISPISLTFNWSFLHSFALLPGSSPCCWPAEISSFCISGDYWLDSFWWFPVIRKKSQMYTSVTDLLKQIFSWLWDVYPDVQIMSDLGALICSSKFHHISFVCYLMNITNAQLINADMFCSRAQ